MDRNSYMIPHYDIFYLMLVNPEGSAEPINFQKWILEPINFLGNSIKVTFWHWMAPKLGNFQTSKKPSNPSIQNPDGASAAIKGIGAGFWKLNQVEVTSQKENEAVFFSLQKQISKVELSRGRPAKARGNL